MTEQPRKRVTIDAPTEFVILAARHLDATEGPVQVGSIVDTSARSAITTVLRYITKAHNCPTTPAPDTATTDQSPAHGCTIDGQPAMPILISEHTELVARAAQAEDLLRVAHETSNKSEAERARYARLAEERRAHIIGVTADRDGLRTRLAEQEAETMRQHEHAQRAEAELRRYTEAESADAAAGSYAGRAEQAEAGLHQARETNRRLNQRAQQLESELAAYRRAVDQWEVSERGTYVPLRTIAAIAKAAGRDIETPQWLLHYQRVEQAEAALARVRDIPRMPHHSQRTGELGRAYTRGWESVITAIDAALGDPQPTTPTDEQYRFATTWSEYNAGRKAAADRKAATPAATEVRDPCPHKDCRPIPRRLMDVHLAVEHPDTQGGESDRRRDDDLRALHATLSRIRNIDRVPPQVDPDSDTGRGYTSGWRDALDRVRTELVDLPGAAPAEVSRLAESGVHTPGCDCGHDGMGVSWHGDDCPWRRSVLDGSAPAADPVVAELARAIRLTREYVGADLLPAVEGWAWYDALRRWAPHELPEPEAAPSGDSAPGTLADTACDAYQPPTTHTESGVCGRCGMYDYKHRPLPGYLLTSPEWQPGDGHARCPELWGTPPIQCLFRAGHPPHGCAFDESKPSQNAAPRPVPDAEPDTVTDPAWLCQQYAKAIAADDGHPWDTLPADRQESYLDNADAVMRVRDRHLEQLRQRLTVAEHFHQDIAAVRERADRLAADLDEAREEEASARERAAYAADHAITACKNHDQLRKEAEQRADELAADLRALQGVADADSKQLAEVDQRCDRYAATLERVRQAVHIADAVDATDWQRGYRACANRVVTELDSKQAPAWTPPPPGDTREQLPEKMLDLIRDRMPDYISTACQTADALACTACYPGSGIPRSQYDEIREHAERLHERCRINQKFTGQLCSCGCH